MFGVRNWLTPMHSTSSLAFSIFLARFSPICVGIAFLRTGFSAAEHPALPSRTQGMECFSAAARRWEQDFGARIRKQARRNHVSSPLETKSDTGRLEPLPVHPRFHDLPPSERHVAGLRRPRVYRPRERNRRDVRVSRRRAYDLGPRRSLRPG